MASSTAEAEHEMKATTSMPPVSNGVDSGEETIPKAVTMQSLNFVKRVGSSSISSWLPSRTKILEVLVLSCVIVTAWGLLLAPTIVYGLPPQQVS